MLTEFWSFSSYVAPGLAAVAIPGLVMLPVLVEMAPVHVSSERQVLDRSPDQVGTDDCEVEVGVATRQTIRWSQAGHEVGADQGLARIAILQLSIGTVDAAR